MVVHRTTAVIIFGSPTKFLVVLGLPDYHYFDPCPTLSAVAYLEGLVEEETEVGEDDPQLLPAIAVLELTQQVTTQLVL